MSNANESAFAVQGHYTPNGEYSHGHDGLTKRELFAAMALQGYLAGPGVNNEVDDFDEWKAEVVSQCVEFADALLAELAK